MKSVKNAAWALLVLSLGALGCSGDAANPALEPDAAQSSFGQLQRHIFNQRCVVCHSANGSAARESGLNLEPAVAYRNLVGAAPTNPAAKELGLYRVFPRDPDKSLLYHKLQWSNEHHASRLGNPMPLGGESLSIGQIEFVRLWIAAGAPLDGIVVDSMLLFDTRKPAIENFQPLAPPAQGYQLRIEPFEVAPNFERELFLYSPVGNPTEIFVSRVETRMRANSHHLLVLAFRDTTPPDRIPRHNVIRDIRAPDGSMIYQNMLVMGWQDYFAGAATGSEDKRLPAGVALRLPANASLDLNSHYVNRGSLPITGEVFVNLHTVPLSQVQKVARSFSFVHDTFELPPTSRTTLRRTFLLDREARILMLTSHNHEMGEKYVIRIAGGPRDGEVIYTSTDWKHPVVTWFDPPLILQAGQGLTSEVTYNNPTAQSVRHGFTSREEMNIMRGYVY